MTLSLILWREGFISLGGAALLTAAFVPATIGILATGTIFAISSFGLGIAVDAIDEHLGYSKDFTNAVKEYFQ
ncbi:hypothetical protein [Vibrio sp. TRT 29B02]|uniref:hypothetical protein n=1 Tax=Vibrio sp. TRT 29B02 TaxID=3418508 RepID=UPI003CF7B4EF